MICGDEGRRPEEDTRRDMLGQLMDDTRDKILCFSGVLCLDLLFSDCPKLELADPVLALRDLLRREEEAEALFVNDEGGEDSRARQVEMVLLFFKFNRFRLSVRSTFFLLLGGLDVVVLLR